MPPATLPDLHRIAPPGLGTFRALRHYNYRLYFAGQLISLTGSWVQATALTWLAYEVTGRSRWPALVSVAQVLPTLLLGLWGGGLADRLPRRGLIFLTQSLLLASALTLASLVAGGSITPTALLGVALAIGVVNSVDTPARLAFVIDLVGREDLANAVALNSLLFNVARAVGPALGGVLLDRVGPASCFLLNGLTFVAVLVALPCMRLPARPAASAVGPPPGTLGDAFRYLAGRRNLVLLLILAGALAFFGWPLLSLLPALADGQLHPPDRKAAALYSAGLLGAVGAGALCGALVVATLGARRRAALIAAGVATGALSVLALAAARSLPVALVGCAGAGAGLILFFATGQAALQLGSADHNRGRVLGIWLMVLSGAHPLGHVTAGLLADAWGTAPVLAGQAAGIALSGLVVAALARRPRGEKS